jgi:hypothetical protein
VAVGPPKRKTFEGEGVLLDEAHAKAIRSRNVAMKELIAALCELDEAALSADKSLVGPAHHCAGPARLSFKTSYSCVRETVRTASRLLWLRTIAFSNVCIRALKSVNS